MDALNANTAKREIGLRLSGPQRLYDPVDTKNTKFLVSTLSSKVFAFRQTRVFYTINVHSDRVVVLRVRRKRTI